jgi:predicted unusual protein kinase regulating ubiquinone biosynthesis (AarF/ABC1/UbiB family)
MKLASFPMRLSGDWENLLAQFDGIQRMLEQETDYEQEALLQEAVRRALSGLEDVVVPRVIRELSTRRVLTMEYLDGLHLEPFLATHPAQELRDRHGAQLTRASMRLWYRERLVYADPHPGNYLFLPDGRLGLLDFGCCHRFRDEEFEYVMEVERAGSQRDDERVVAALAHGCDMQPHELAGERLRMMREYCDWVWAPLRTDEPFDYGTPGQYRDGVRLYGEFVKRRWVRSRPVNIWLNKVFFGVRAMLTRLEARVAYGRILREESPA